VCKDVIAVLFPTGGCKAKLRKSFRKWSKSKGIFKKREKIIKNINTRKTEQRN
jgi:hypothetical protein